MPGGYFVVGVFQVSADVAFSSGISPILGLEFDILGATRRTILAVLSLDDPCTVLSSGSDSPECQSQALAEIPGNFCLSC